MEAGGGLCGRINKQHGRQEEVRFQTPILGSQEQKEGVLGSMFREFGLKWVSSEAQRQNFKERNDLLGFGLICFVIPRVLKDEIALIRRPHKNDYNLYVLLFVLF